MRSCGFVWSLTNDGLHIFWVICDIEELSSTESIVQRFLKGSEMVENLRSHQGSKCPTPERLILIQDLAVNGQQIVMQDWKVGLAKDLFVLVLNINDQF